IALLPEDRRQHGLVLEASIGANLTLPNLHQYQSLGFLRHRAEQAFHQRAIEQLAIKTPSAAKAAGLLSGGNQQKIVFAKWLERKPAVLLLDEPTRGVDVGAKTEIYRLMDELAQQGVAIGMITSDMEELLGMADRAVVLHEGRIAGELARHEFNEEAVLRAATGGGIHHVA
ncbi:MAG: ATP-binding cassette domain-containing protein, partial [Gemmataceae bacterium]